MTYFGDNNMCIKKLLLPAAGIVLLTPAFSMAQQATYKFTVANALQSGLGVTFYQNSTCSQATCPMPSLTYIAPGQTATATVTANGANPTADLYIQWQTYPSGGSAYTSHYQLRIGGAYFNSNGTCGSSTVVNAFSYWQQGQNMNSVLINGRSTSYTYANKSGCNFEGDYVVNGP